MRINPRVMYCVSLTIVTVGAHFRYKLLAAASKLGTYIT
jgi:hypothetical protein